MNRKNCIEQLKDLKKHCEYQHQNSDEIWGEDVKALEYAIKELERTAQEVSVQEQTNIYYPIELSFTAPLMTSSCFDKNKIIHSEDAINLKLKINSSEYDKQEILKELNSIYQKLHECFR